MQQSCLYIQTLFKQNTEIKKNATLRLQPNWRNQIGNMKRLSGDEIIVRSNRTKSVDKKNLFLIWDKAKTNNKFTLLK